MARKPTQRTTRTTLGRWMNAYGMRTADLHARCVSAVELVGLTVGDVPSVKSLADIALGRYVPNPAVMLIIRHVTRGDVDLEHWVRDLFTVNSQAEKVANAVQDPLHASVCHPPTVAPVSSS